MPVGIYQDSNPSSLVSDGDNTNPIIFKTSNLGGVEERKLYLRHQVLAGDGAESTADISIKGLDIATEEDDVSTWIQVAPDVAGSPGTYGAAGAAVNIGNVNLGEIRPFWIKATVPVNTEIGGRDDLKLNVSAASTNTIAKSVDLSSSTYSGEAIFDGANNRIAFDYTSANDTGEVITPWVDVAGATEIHGLTYDITGGTFYAVYRMADDASGTNATQWVPDPANLDLNKDFVQAKLNFYGQPINFGQGLTKEIYSGTAFNTLITTVHGDIPYDPTPGDGFITGNYSVKYLGWFLAEEGGTYNFRIDTDDGQRLYIDGVNILDFFAGGPRSHNANVVLTKGYHFVEYHFYQGGGGQYMYSYVTEPGNAMRAIQLGDFVDNTNNPNSPSPLHTYVYNLYISYTGPYENNFDLRFYMGPATPELIDPPDGSTSATLDSNPLLTAVSGQCDAIQFQLDNINTFDGAELLTWEVPASDGVPVTTQSPESYRPGGQWFWRARAKYNGYYGNWSDYWAVTIIGYSTNDVSCYIYNEIPTIDPLTLSRVFYINVNTGEAAADIYFMRYMYINVNVATGAGEIIYPLYDKTATRKETFPEDGDMFS